jgi:hypothetical protein
MNIAQYNCLCSLLTTLNGQVSPIQSEAIEAFLEHPASQALLKYRCSINGRRYGEECPEYIGHGLCGWGFVVGCDYCLDPED